MARKKILLTVTTYPLPSRSYDELVCTAGLLEDGSWIRIYPIPLSFLRELKHAGIVKDTKYTWIELDLEKRPDDFRPESHSPKDYQFKDMHIGEHLDTGTNWAERKKYCLQNVYTNLTQLIDDSKAPNNTSLATFKPTEITGFEIEKDTDDWKPVWKALQQQLTLFGETGEPRKVVPKVPYKFYYRFIDDQGKKSAIDDRGLGNWDALLELHEKLWQ